MKCYHCNAELAPNAKFCRHCGKKIVTFCSECGLELEEGAKFCTGCGAKVEEIAEEKKKTDILPTMEEIALDMTEKVLEKVEGDNHSTHIEEMRNAKPAQVEAPARSEMPAKPQSSTHSDGSAGGAGQKIRRSSASVRDAAAQQAKAGADQAPVAAPVEPAQAPAYASTQTPVQTQSTPVREQAPVQTAQPAVSPQPVAPTPQAAPVQTPVQAPIAPPVKPSVVPPLVNTGADLTKKLIAETTDTAIKGAIKAGSTAKKVAIIAAVFAFLIGAAAACLNFFVPAPDDTVNNLVTSVEELDCDKMLGCFDSKTEKQIRAAMGLTGELFGSLTGISIDLEDLMAFAPSMAPYLEIPDLGIASAETILYADCSKNKIMQYCTTANNGGSIPTGYLSDNEIVSFLMEYKISLPGLENLIAETAIVKITLENGEVGYFPLINEGWGDWRIPMMDMAGTLG